jgi:hypothetical protein
MARFPEEASHFYIFERFQTVWESQILFLTGIGDLPHELIRQGRVADHSHPPSVVAENAWSFISALPHSFMAFKKIFCVVSVCSYFVLLS